MAIQRREAKVFVRVLVVVVVFLCVQSVVTAQESSETDQVAPAAAETNAEEQRVVLGLEGGFGRFIESTVEQDSGLWFVGTFVRWNPGVRSELFGEFDFSQQEREYTQVGIGSAGVVPRVLEEEIQFDTSVAYGYDVLHVLDVNWLFYAGWRHLSVLNDRFDHHLTGGMIGSRFEWPISTMFSIDLRVDYAMNLLSIADETAAGSADSSTGDILGSLRFGSGLRIAASDRVQFGLAYDGEHQPYDFTDLIIHRLAIEFAVHFWL